MRRTLAMRRLDRAEEEAREAIRNLVDGGLGLSLKESVGEASSYANESADLGSETFERGKDFALYRGLVARLDAIEAARGRVRAGTYGRCGRCGQAIGEDRLAALPWTELCIACQEAVEAAAMRERPARTLEEAIVAMPFGQGPESGREPVEFDGEDAWQAVARYGTANGPQDEPGAVGPGGAYADADETVGVVEAVEAIPDPRADTPAQALALLARRGRVPAPDGAGAPAAAPVPRDR